MREGECRGITAAGCKGDGVGDEGNCADEVDGDDDKGAATCSLLARGGDTRDCIVGEIPPLLPELRRFPGLAHLENRGQDSPSDIRSLC